MQLDIDFTKLLKALLIVQLVAHLSFELLLGLSLFLLKYLLLLLHLEGEFRLLCLQLLESLLTIVASRLELELLAFKLLLLLDLLLLQLLSSLLDFPLLFFLLLTDFLLHLFHLFVDVLIHLELLKLLLVGLLHRFVPVITRFTVDQWVHVKIVLVVTNKDSITVLELIWIFKQLAIHLDFELARIIIVWHECGRSVITVKVQATLLISDTDTLDSDGRREVSILLAHVVVTLV